MSTKQDQLYAEQHAQLDGFRFDAKVADVFADMIARSVPGYTQILALLPTLVRRFAAASQEPNSATTNTPPNYYDLGCSLGAGMVAMAQGLREEGVPVIGIDTSQDMLNGAKIALDKLRSDYSADFKLECADINNTDLENAAMVLMNFTLQFIPLVQRDNLVKKIYTSLNPGGVLVLSEKVHLNDHHAKQLLTDVHHQYKADQGYSQLEISQKRDAIENVLISETFEQHHLRLKSVGFSCITPWIQNLQFISILAVK